jgi:tRNA(fMet)-specific endonuclease VapC
MYLLDTTTVSALMRSEPRVGSRVRKCSPGDVGVPQPVFAEVEYGLARLPRSRRKTLLHDRWSVIERALGRVPWTDAVSRRFGELKAELERAGLRLDDFDVAIAAHALEADAILVTSNVRHLSRVPSLEIEDWERG